MADFAMGLTTRELGIVLRSVANAAEAHQHVRKLRADLEKQWSNAAGLVCNYDDK
jgi:hypothetical protein